MYTSLRTTTTYISEKYINEHVYTEGVVSKIKSWFKKMASGDKTSLTETELELLKQEKDALSAVFSKAQARGVKCHKAAKRKRDVELENIKCNINLWRESLDGMLSIKMCKYSTKRSEITKCKRQRQLLIGLLEMALENWVKEKDALEEKGKK